ncbi:MAG: alpha/beta fold hydrolase [Deltaproteobacteria bacterium]|nr:alpha/beta fold hydrolase [Deltaproteobacteria bacterium]
MTFLPLIALTLLAAASCSGEASPSDAGDGVDATVLDSGPADVGSPRDGGRAGQDTGAGDASLGLGPPYPIVLAHGFFGFEDFAGVGFITYFHGVKDALGIDGEALVFTPEVDPFNTSEVRGAELIERIEAILAMTGHAKVNIIGHSQGGLDARVVAHDRPDLVASITTVATPHRGSRISDVILGLVSDDRLRNLVDELARAIGAPLFNEVGEATSVVASLGQFSTEGAAVFNTNYTDRIDVAYYSLTGVSDWAWGSACRTAAAPPWLDRYADDRDPVDVLLSVSEAILDGGLLDTFPNDGLVRVVDARWGRFLGCVPADHLDEVGQLLGDSPGRGNDFDHRQLYIDIVRFLRTEGH